MAQKTITFRQFKKQKSSKLHSQLVHPIIKTQQKFDFMQKYVPKYTVPEIPGSAESETPQARQDQLFEKIRAMKTFKDKQRLRQRDANI